MHARHALRNRIVAVCATVLSLAVLAVTGAPSASGEPVVAPSQDIEKLRVRASDAAAVLDEVMKTRERSIPARLLEEAVCVAVIPGVKKVGFIVGGRYGRGLASCRVEGGWSRPSFLSLGGGSIGLQIGGQSTDFVLVFMNRRAAEGLSEDDFTLGADAAVAAGPVGRNAAAGTNYTLDAEIYSYSRSRGLFVGVSLEGAKLSPDQDANWAVYDERVIPEDLLFGRAGTIPEPARAFVGALDRHAPRSP